MKLGIMVRQMFLYQFNRFSDNLWKGRFLRGVLSDLSQWYMSEKAYDAGQRHKSGSKTAISPGFCKRWIKEGTPTQEDLLPYGDFKFFVRKCHRKLGRVRDISTL